MSTSHGESSVSGSRSSFHGRGIQVSGSGDTTIHGNVHIGASDLNQLLSDLRVTNPRHDKERIESTKGGLLRDSYRWILEHEGFQSWCNDPRGGVLWIKGDAGKGKTMLVCGIVSEMEQSSDHAENPAYFFCQASDERINTATAVLRGLLFMLVSQHPELCSYIEADYNKEGKSLFEGRNAWFALARIFGDMLEDSALEGKIMVIDALDECVVDLPNLLDLISTAVSSSQHIKWIVSSRNWPPVEEELDAISQKVTLRLELNVEAVSAAVQNYIRYKVEELVKRKGYDAQLREEVSVYLAANANGTFLWAALVCEELGKPGAQKRLAAARLKTFPPGLDEVYRRMMDLIMENSENQDVCKQVLAVVSLAYRPLALEELAVLSGFAADNEDLEEVVRFCASFLTLQEGTVYLVHQSAGEYLLKQALAQIMPLGISQQHCLMSSRSLVALSMTLQRDVYHLREHGISIDDISTPNPDPLAPVRYSCVHWVDHLQESSRLDKSWTEQDIADGGSVHLFFQRKFLFWLEALSLQRSMTQAVLAVRKIEALISRAETRHLGKLIKDARRFLLYHRGIVETAPLQLYMAALVFTPAHSLVRSTYKEEQPSWITLTPDMDSDWDACTQTLETGGRVCPVVFSPDGKQLAAAYGSSPNEILVWDTTTGACLLKLQDVSNTVAFSSDGQWLASGSRKDGCVRVWEIAKSTRGVKTIESGTAAVVSVIFWPGCLQLISSHCEGSIKVWDLKTSTCLQTIKGTERSRISLVLSPTNEQIASIDHNRGGMKVWDLTAGRCVLKTAIKVSSKPTWAIFSANGQFIAVGSSNSKSLTATDMEIWETSTGERVTMRTIPSDTHCAAFSPDGQWLALSDFRGRINILDASTYEHIRTFSGHRDSVWSVAFSPDGLLASGSFDRTVRIHDMMVGMREQATKRHNDVVSSVAFLPDGQRLISVSHDGTFNVWDVATGECKQSLGHDEKVIFATFSPDGRWFASLSSKATTTVWSAERGDCLHTAVCSKDNYPSAKITNIIFDTRYPAFSLDSQRLVLVQAYKVVNVWDLVTCSCTHTFERRGTGAICSLSPSAGHRVLISVWVGSDFWDQAIEIWDAETGACVQSFSRRGHHSRLMAFSNDGLWFASIYDNAEICVQNATTGACVQTLLIDNIDGSRTLAFDTKLDMGVSTDIGVFLLDPPELHLQRLEKSKTVGLYQGYGISPDKVWIVYRGKRLLWLPSEYRPHSSAVSGSLIALGCTSGSLHWLNFAPDSTEETDS